MSLDMCTPHPWTKEALLLIPLHEKYLIIFILVAWAALLEQAITMKMLDGGATSIVGVTKPSVSIRRRFQTYY
ncbi:hypothetical protein ACTXT7_001484 [Hymenolepis weldensis]